jgi:hypothetical protein
VCSSDLDLDRFEDGPEELGEETLQEGDAVIWDDLSKPSDRQVRILRELLVVLKRHLDLIIYVLAHSVVGNNLTSVVIQFDEIVYTWSARNEKTFLQIGRYLKLDPDRTAAIWADFVRGGEKGRFLRFAADKQDFTVVDERNRPKENRKILFKNKLASYLEGEEHLAAKLKLFDYIFDQLPDKALHGDFTLRTVAEATKEKSRCNLLDLLQYMVDPDAGTPPRNVRAVISALQQNIDLPQYFIKNPQLQ